MATSVVAIVVRTFEIGIERIPIAGANITFNDGAFTALSLMGMVYFGIQFGLYYWIDLNNGEVTEHEQRSHKKLETKLEWFHHPFVEYAQKRLTAICGSISYSNCHTKEYFKSLESIHPLALEEVLPPIDKGNFIPSGTKHLSDDEKSALWKEMRRLGRWYRALFAAYWLAQKSRHAAVKLAYLVRNHGLDGILPIAMGVIGIAVIFGLDLRWLTHLLPMPEKH